MTEMLVKRRDRRDLENKNLSASLFWYTRSRDEEDPDKGHQLELLGEICTQRENSCTEDVHDNRKIYVPEIDGEVDELFLVLVNKASLNDPD